MRALGIDIGTTSICVVLYDREGRRLLLNKSVRNEFLSQGGFLQDADKITEKVKGLVQGIAPDDFDAVGISSQMHGIVYVDENARAVTPFYTWKEESGRQRYRGDLSYEAYLSRETGYPMYSGYGSVTHFYLKERKELPGQAKGFTDIGDFLAMQLTGSRRIAVNESMGASFGGFDLTRGRFDLAGLEKAGVDVESYPSICPYRTPAGLWKGKPVFSAVGDNQASFLGAVREPESGIGVNVGTGSQVSVYFPRLCETAGRDSVEIRPFPGGGYLYVGASLNGGKVYERLAAFFEEICEQFTGIRPDVYEKMCEIGEQKKNTDLQAFPNLYGMRGGEKGRSGLSGLTEENFHPADLIRSYVRGMAEELGALYGGFPEETKRGRKTLTVSGNGLRKNPMLCRAVEEVFMLPLVFSEFQEEAAAGAAEFACRMAEKTG